MTKTSGETREKKMREADNVKIKKIIYKSTWPPVGPMEVDINE